MGSDAQYNSPRVTETLKTKKKMLIFSKRHEPYLLVHHSRGECERAGVLVPAVAAVHVQGELLALGGVVVRGQGVQGQGKLDLGNKVYFISRKMSMVTFFFLYLLLLGPDLGLHD